MPIDLSSIIEIGKKALRCKEELEREEEHTKRIYGLSRMLPEKEGYELIQIFEQSKKDIIRVQKVLHEK